MSKTHFIVAAMWSGALLQQLPACPDYTITACVHMYLNVDIGTVYSSHKCNSWCSCADDRYREVLGGGGTVMPGAN